MIKITKSGRTRHVNEGKELKIFLEAGWTKVETTTKDAESFFKPEDVEAVLSAKQKASSKK